VSRIHVRLRGEPFQDSTRVLAPLLLRREKDVRRPAAFFLFCAVDVVDGSDPQEECL
jgi:hypothetical protein